ncbi:hypothetical protein FGG08_004594 [Glutinoglossum americanum]|uniref:Uncharacterized protein n=1 Tax=Glutinoglossum americanum TaxID=1670608 RepID=A0A9P8HW40_9PEZI|nr:hypothetical protein FGG08_004594 [Glutinoglossum americanum]
MHDPTPADAELRPGNLSCHQATTISTDLSPPWNVDPGWNAQISNLSPKTLKQLTAKGEEATASPSTQGGNFISSIRSNTPPVYLLVCNDSKPSPREISVPPIRETEPDQVKALWKRVIRHNNSAMSKPEPARAGKQQARNPITTTAAASSRLGDTNPKDDNFRDAVLQPHGIQFTQAIEDMQAGTPYAHFGSRPPTGPMLAHYRGLHPDSHVWIQLDDNSVRHIIDQYRLCREAGRSEPKLAWAHLLKNDSYVNVFESPVKEITYSTSHDRLPGEHEQPPIIKKTTDTRPFQFSIKPDITYRLSLRLFNPEHRNLVKFTTVAGPYDGVACYLTGEFSKHYNGSNIKAENKIAAASAFWLYARWQLRRNRLSGEKRNDISASDFTDIKHYGLIFHDPYYTIWLIKPKTHSDGQWNGASVAKLFEGDLLSMCGVRTFERWLNEIHHWGLGTWLKRFKDDVKGIVRRMEGGEGGVSTQDGREGMGEEYGGEQGEDGWQEKSEDGKGTKRDD